MSSKYKIELNKNEKIRKNSLILLFLGYHFFIMVCEGIIHCIGHSGSEFELWIHLGSTFWSNCIFNFWAVLLAEIFTLSIF